jgi:hypothetical protein
MINPIEYHEFPAISSVYVIHPFTSSKEKQGLTSPDPKLQDLDLDGASTLSVYERGELVMLV